MSDRGTTFTFHDFKNYCEEEAIAHLLVVSGVLRGNGRVETINRLIIGVLTKITISDPQSLCKHHKLERILLMARTNVALIPYHLNYCWVPVYDKRNICIPEDL